MITDWLKIAALAEKLAVHYAHAISSATPTLPLIQALSLTKASKGLKSLKTIKICL